MIVDDIAIIQFKELIIAQEFHEAHEIFEEYWFENRDNKSSEIRTIKGFINAAVSFELFKRGKISQSERVWENYLRLVELEQIGDNHTIKRFTELKYFLDNYNIKLKN